MILLPAIDLLNGQCVRLYKGAYDTAEQVAEDAMATAGRFAAAGARWLHMVDLDGAREGAPRNDELVCRVAAASDLRVEVGGGIRELATVARYLDNGVTRVILGTAALNDPAFVRAAVREYGQRIAVGIDARDGYAAAEGWLQTSRVHYLELARAMEESGVATLIFTDISRDGAMSGPNLEQLAALNDTVSCHVIASGGVSTLVDVQALQKLGLYGAICGKAVYNGSLDLEAALQLTEE